MTNPIRFGKFVQLFYFTRSGQTYIKRNRLQSIIKECVRKAVQKAKEDVAEYISKFWAQETLKMNRDAIRRIYQNAFYDMTQPFGITIGSDLEYAQYVFSMAARMRRRGKAVNWTNPLTRKIEYDIIGNTERYAFIRFKYHVNNELTNVGLGWMTGKGRMPKDVELLYYKNAKHLPRYYGASKIIQWMK